MWAANETIMESLFYLFSIAMRCYTTYFQKCTFVTITWYRLSGLKVCLSHTFVHCNNHLVSFIKVEGLFVSYIVTLFDTIKSKMTDYRYIVVDIFDTIKSKMTV